MLLFCFDPMFDCFEIFAYLRGGEFFGSSLVNILLTLLERNVFLRGDLFIFESRSP